VASLTVVIIFVVDIPSYQNTGLAQQKKKKIE